MGRPLHALCIGRGPTHVLYNAAHHANEWITTPVLLRFLEEYAAAYAHNGSLHGQSASNLFDSTTLTVVPLVNPDGVDLVTGALPNESPFFINAQQLAFNYPAVPFPDGWKANILGVDLNLNYPAGWEEAKKIKESQGYTRPGPRDYVGPAPFSEPESAALAALTEAHSYRLTLSYHTQGEVIYYKYLDFQPPYALAIGQAFSRASGYALEQTPYESGFAGYKDWFIQSFDRPGYTIEAGRGTNPLPLDDFDSIYRDNLGILVQGLVLVR